MRTANRILKQVLSADPLCAQKQRDLSISFDRLGDVSVAAGDLAAARAYYEQGLAISRTLADADPASAQKQRDLSISFNKLGDVSVAAGDLAAARDYYEQGLAISRSAGRRRSRLGTEATRPVDLVQQAGGRERGRGRPGRRTRLLRTGPGHQPHAGRGRSRLRTKQRDLSISFNRLGDVSVVAGDLAAARDYYEQGLAIRRTLADADPASARSNATCRSRSISWET